VSEATVTSIERPRCSHGDCDTILSAYNEGARCSVHEAEVEAEVDRSWGDRHMPEGPVCGFDGCERQAWKDRGFCRAHTGGLTKEQRIAKAKELRAEGLTLDEIGARLGVVSATASDYVWEMGNVGSIRKAKAASDDGEAPESESVQAESVDASDSSTSSEAPKSEAASSDRLLNEDEAWTEVYAEILLAKLDGINPVSCPTVFDALADRIERWLV